MYTKGGQFFGQGGRSISTKAQFDHRYKAEYLNQSQLEGKLPNVMVHKDLTTYVATFREGASIVYSHSNIHQSVVQTKKEAKKVYPYLKQAYSTDIKSEGKLAQIRSEIQLVSVWHDSTVLGKEVIEPFNKRSNESIDAYKERVSGLINNVLIGETDSKLRENFVKKFVKAADRGEEKVVVADLMNQAYQLEAIKDLYQNVKGNIQKIWDYLSNLTFVNPNDNNKIANILFMTQNSHISEVPTGCYCVRYQDPKRSLDAPKVFANLVHSMSDGNLPESQSDKVQQLQERTNTGNVIEVAKSSNAIESIFYVPGDSLVHHQDVYIAKKGFSEALEIQTHPKEKVHLADINSSKEIAISTGMDSLITIPYDVAKQINQAVNEVDRTFNGSPEQMLEAKDKAAISCIINNIHNPEIKCYCEGAQISQDKFIEHIRNEFNLDEKFEPRK